MLSFLPFIIDKLRYRNEQRNPLMPNERRPQSFDMDEAL